MMGIAALNPSYGLSSRTCSGETDAAVAADYAEAGYGKQHRRWTEVIFPTASW